MEVKVITLKVAQKEKKENINPEKALGFNLI